jgi:hypothetical protein
VGAQRLRNQHTFIATRNQLLIVDGDGKQVFAWSPPAKPIIIAAARGRTGQTAVAVSGGVCMLIDADGKELKRINVGQMLSTIGASIDLAANGNVVVPLYQQNQVAEFDWTGNKVWSADCRFPLAVTRLASGNTLVTSSSTPYRVAEFDRAGREVWSYQPDGRPFRARRR